MYKLERLPYNYDALEPYIDTHTLGLHHNKHQQNYLNKLNALLIKNNYDFKYSIEELAQNIDKMNFDNKEDIMFNLGGVVNHNIYFKSMSPNKNMPNVILNDMVNRKFGNLDNFKKEFKEKALSLKGSGYTFLVVDDNNNLDIINLSNQDSSYFHDLTPLIALDMWEHAYYINYENKKDIYVDNFFDVLDFSQANNKILELNLKK